MPAKIDKDTLYTTRELMTLLNIGYKAIKSYRLQGLKSMAWGNKIYFRGADVLEYHDINKK